MATKETWDKLRYFKPDSKIDNWGDPDAISDVHLLRLDDFRHYLGCPVYVSRGVSTTGHSPRSYHYSRTDSRGVQIGACATDILIPDYPDSPFDLLMDVTRFGFTGIGYYPHWTWRGKTVGGLHVDSRPLKWEADETLNYKHSRWMGVPDKNGKQKYIELNWHNLVLHVSQFGDDFGDINSVH